MKFQTFLLSCLITSHNVVKGWQVPLIENSNVLEDTLHLWPPVKSVTIGNSTLILPKRWRWIYKGKSEEVRKMIRETTRRHWTDFESSKHIVAHHGIVKCGNEHVPLHLADESYELNVSKDISLTANSWVGCLRGLQTFNQIASRRIDNVPIFIQDSPWLLHRGLMLDTARHFIPLHFLEKILLGMSLNKLNVLHWHIVDSQSFPISRKKSANHYSYGDIKRIVSVANDNGIRVIPEFDLPGHATSWQQFGKDFVVCANQDWKKYALQPPAGQLNINHPDIFPFLQSFFQNMTTLFKDPLIHIGGDEINLACYQDFLPGFKPLDISLFFQQLWKKLSLVGKDTIVWHDLSKHVALPSNSWVQVWGTDREVEEFAKRGYQVIASPNQAYYLDCGLGNPSGIGESWCGRLKSTLELYQYNLSSSISGAEVTMWTEMVDEHNLLTTLFPRILGVAGKWWNKQLLPNPKLAISRARQTLLDHNIPSSPLWPEWCEKHSCE